jgi:hypothetical protein
MGDINLYSRVFLSLNPQAGAFPLPLRCRVTMREPCHNRRNDRHGPIVHGPAMRRTAMRSAVVHEPEVNWTEASWCPFP